LQWTQGVRSRWPASEERSKATEDSKRHKRVSCIKDDSHLQRYVRQGTGATVVAELVQRPRPGGCNRCLAKQGDVTEILGNKDETSLLRPRNQIEDGGLFTYRVGAVGL
jgi:hypothetical protein